MDVRSAINKYKKNKPALQTYAINVKKLGGNTQLREKMAAENTGALTPMWGKKIHLHEKP
jgi:hypothetical protein